MTVVVAVVVAVCTVGVSTLVWGTVGLWRLAAERRRVPGLLVPSMFYRPEEVAVLIAAHNEEPVIGDAVAAARGLVPARNVFVVSDGSDDATVERSRAAGATTWDLTPNRGKAGAIRAGVERFRIPERFPLLLLLDADSRPRADYLRTALPLFTDPGVVAVAGRATTAPDAPKTGMGRVLTSYRERTYLCTQYLHKFGQAAPAADAVAIVPGFASLNRTDVLDRIDIDAPGLSIEDFNMTFEVHAKRLGRIAFHPEHAVAETQDPAVLRDYSAQMRRWSLGFWQTVRRHGVHRGLFWTSVGLFAAETVIASVVLAAVVPVLVLAAIAAVGAGVLPTDAARVSADIAAAVPVLPIIVGLLLVDTAMTAFACAVGRRRPRLYMLAFPLLRLWDAMLCLRALLAALGRPSDGKWKSPDRRPRGPSEPGLAVSVRARTDDVAEISAGAQVTRSRLRADTPRAAHAN